MIIKTQPKRAFSLIELLISLIVISCITAAFTPLITKKFSSGVFGFGSSGGESSGPVSTKCDDKFTAECLLCNDKACLSCSKICPDDLCQDVDNCVCKECPTTEFPNCAKFTSTGCLQCKNGYSLADGKCAVCPDGRYSDNGKECKYCEAGFWPSEDKGSCEPCPSGYICNDGVQIQCSGNTAPIIEEDILGNKTHVCAPCPEGSYCVDGVATECSKKWKNCTKCSETECLACSDETILSNGKCVEGMDDILEIDGLYATKFNMGDKATLPIPTSVTMLATGTSTDSCESGKCCWKGTTAGSCDANNGGYSGCTRTVCNWAAAKEICARFNLNGENWRLPTRTEMSGWNAHSLGIGTNGLQLCSHTSSSNSNYAKCYNNTKCFGAFYKYCYANQIWTNEIAFESNMSIYTYYLDGINWNQWSLNAGESGSVRCVATMSDCPKGQYKNGSSCVNCASKFKHCGVCSSSKCSACESGYNLHPYNNKCYKIIEDAVPVDNLYVTKFNMGDKSLPIPASVTVINTTTGTNCTTEKCCWQGKTADPHNCDTKNSFNNSNYSGCTRTVCNWYAANEICAKYTAGGKTWRLPKKTEVANWLNYDNTLGASSLQICDGYDESNSTYCRNGDTCKGATEDINGYSCYPYCIWLQSVSTNSANYALLDSSYNVTIWRYDGNRGKKHAQSVRCVTEIDYD